MHCHSDSGEAAEESAVAGSVHAVDQKQILFVAARLVGMTTLPQSRFLTSFPRSARQSAAPAPSTPE